MLSFCNNSCNTHESILVSLQCFLQHLDGCRSSIPSNKCRVMSVGWWTFNCQLFSCLAVKTIPFCWEIVVTFCPFCSEVHASIRCIKSDVARTSRSNCRRKALDFLRLFGDGYFKESDTKIMKESFHWKCGQRQDLHFNLVCRLSRKLISAASISLLFICTDCQRDFMRTSSFPYVSNESNLTSRHHTEKAALFLTFHFSR